MSKKSDKKFYEKFDNAKMKEIQSFYRSCDAVDYIYIAERSDLLAFHIIASKKTKIPELWVAGDGFNDGTPFVLLFGLTLMLLSSNFLEHNMEQLFALVMTLCIPEQPVRCDNWVLEYNLTYEDCNREREERGSVPELTCVEVTYADI